MRRVTLLCVTLAGVWASAASAAAPQHITLNGNPTTIIEQRLAGVTYVCGVWFNRTGAFEECINAGHPTAKPAAKPAKGAPAA